MEKDIFKEFKERGRGMEEAYFRQQDAKLIERLHQEAKLEEIAIALAEKLQVDNPDLLRRVTELGVTVDSALPFFLAPLVHVAWAEGTVTPSSITRRRRSGLSTCSFSASAMAISSSLASCRSRSMSLASCWRKYAASIPRSRSLKMSFSIAPPCIAALRGRVPCGRPSSLALRSMVNRFYKYTVLLSVIRNTAGR